MKPRRQRPIDSVTLGDIRQLGCRDLLIYCEAAYCHHRATLNADWLPDDTVIRSARPRMVCTACGLIGDSDVRMDLSPHTGGGGMGAAHSLP